MPIRSALKLGAVGSRLVISPPFHKTIEGSRTFVRDSEMHFEQKHSPSIFYDEKRKQLLTHKAEVIVVIGQSFRLCLGGVAD